MVDYRQPEVVNELVDQARPQDLIPAFAGVSLRTFIRVVRAMRVYMALTNRTELHEGFEQFFQLILDNEELPDGNFDPATTEQGEFCSQALEALRINEELAGDSRVLIREEMHRWFPNN